jgi:hypothetical protein
MHVSLEQAIEIHARALVRRHREKAPCNARKYAAARHECGDNEGHDVWQGVASVATRILAESGSAEVYEDSRG